MGRSIPGSTSDKRLRFSNNRWTGPGRGVVERLSAPSLKVRVPICLSTRKAIERRSSGLARSPPRSGWDRSGEPCPSLSLFAGPGCSSPPSIGLPRSERVLSSSVKMASSLSFDRIRRRMSMDPSWVPSRSRRSRRSLLDDSFWTSAYFRFNAVIRNSSGSVS